MSRRPEQPPFRATALLAALGVLLLAMFAVSPTLHAGLHEVGHAAGVQDHGAPVGDAEHSCAVTLFAQGVMALLVFCLLMLGRPLAAGVVARAVDEIIPSLPRYRFVPSHAPPSA